MLNYIKSVIQVFIICLIVVFGYVAVYALMGDIGLSQDCRIQTKRDSSFINVALARQCVTYSWQTGSWSSCSTSCGSGAKTRSVWCERDDGRTVSVDHCRDSKPRTSKSCSAGSCISGGGGFFGGNSGGWNSSSSSGSDVYRHYYKALVYKSIWEK